MQLTVTETGSGVTGSSLGGQKEEDSGYITKKEVRSRRRCDRPSLDLL